ncbi:MAG TPA: nitroreductase family deazaflavin-dependent oxidoreductase [Streptosporangiaceae bacterium]|nr:nitroreductase family deazaflavin-dependent oxidoreductase [Streptosporangiaceae bacterium]
MDITPSALAARALRTRALVRAPITLYQHGLGWIFGQRILMLEHTGRRSGQARFACLEVVGRPGPERVIIVSGFGERAEWYRNLLADPRCTVSIGRRRRVPPPQSAPSRRGPQSAEKRGIPNGKARSGLDAWPLRRRSSSWTVTRGKPLGINGHGNKMVYEKRSE